jgi:hypothetical protein
MLTRLYAIQDDVQQGTLFHVMTLAFHHGGLALQKLHGHKRSGLCPDIGEDAIACERGVFDGFVPVFTRVAQALQVHGCHSARSPRVCRIDLDILERLSREFISGDRDQGQ